MTNPLELTVVVASAHDGHYVGACLKALQAQLDSHAAELLVSVATEGEACLVKTGFPDVTLIQSEPDSLLPQLWAKGMLRAQGRVVALTTANCVVGPNWADKILKAHMQYHTAIGGAVEMAPGTG